MKYVLETILGLLIFIIFLLLLVGLITNDKIIIKIYAGIFLFVLCFWMTTILNDIGKLCFPNLLKQNKIVKKKKQK